MEHVKLLQREEILSEEIISDAAIDRVADQGDQVLLEKVKNLGYDPVSLRGQGRSNPKGKAKGKSLSAARTVSLGRVIRSLGIKPFTTESVEAYKRAACRGKFQVFDRTLTGLDVAAIVVVGAIFNGIGYYLLGKGLVCLFPGLEFATETGPFPFATALMCTPIVWGIGVFFVATRSANNPAVEEPQENDPIIGSVLEYLCFGSTAWIFCLFDSRKRRWQLVPLSEYEKDIPRHVLVTVSLVHSKCPSAVFLIDELVMKQDPFLKVVLDYEEYYLEVWNEPQFMAKRVV